MEISAWRLHGSFLAGAGPLGFRAISAARPREGAESEGILMRPAPVILAGGDIELNAGRATWNFPSPNLGDRPIQVGSHYHFIETNASLTFDRGAAYGKRLDIPAGTAVRFEPGETKTVKLVKLADEKSFAAAITSRVAKFPLPEGKLR